MKTDSLAELVFDAVTHPDTRMRVLGAAARESIRLLEQVRFEMKHYNSLTSGTLYQINQHLDGNFKRKEEEDGAREGDAAPGASRSGDAPHDPCRGS